MDAVAGTAGNDTINAFTGIVGVTPTSTFGALDSIDGGAGDDVLNVLDNVNALAAVPLAQVANIETANMASVAGVTAVTTGWTGLNKLNVTAGTVASVTSALTTNVAVSGITTGSVTVDGGKDVTVTGTATTAAVNVGVTTGSAGAVNVSHPAQAGSVITVDGGTTVNVTAGGTGATNVGATGKGASGVVTVTSNLAGAATGTGGTITVKGGSEVNVIQVASTPVTGVTTTQSNVVISNDGKTAITKVLVAQTAPVAAVATVSGAVVAATSVGITDLNTATKADTITTVTLDRAAPTAFTGNALTTLNVKGDTSAGAAGNNITINSSLGLAAAVGHALTLNLTGGAIGTVTDSQTATKKFGTININGTTAATTIASLVDTELSGVTISGDAKVTITTLSTLVPVAPLTTTLITSTNTAGVKIGSGLAVTTGFTGAAGDDEVTIGASTQAISMGAGNDTVNITANALAAVSAGDGTDTLAGTDAVLIAGLAADPTALARYTGFEVIKVNDAAVNGSTIDATVFGANSVTFAAGVAAGKTSTVTVGANATVTLAGDLSTATGTLSFSAKTNTAAGNATLVLNSDYTDNNSIVSDAIARTATVTATSIENLTVNSTGKMAAIATPIAGYKADVVTNTLALTDADLTTLTVTGNQKLSFTSGAAQIKLASVDASANTAGVTVSIAAAVANSTTPATLTALATIKGSATGANTLTGSANADVIIGGTAADTITGGKGADTLTGNGGSDVFDYSGATAGLSAFGPGNIDTITDFVANTYGAGTLGALNGKGAAAAATPSVWTGDVIKITAKTAAATDTLKFYVAANTTDALAYIQTNAALLTNVVVLDASTSNLYIENSGPDFSTDLVINLAGVTTLTEAAILLV